MLATIDELNENPANPVGFDKLVCPKPVNGDPPVLTGNPVNFGGPVGNFGPSVVIIVVFFARESLFVPNPVKENFGLSETSECSEILLGDDVS